MVNTKYEIQMKECKNRKDSGQYEQRARREANPIVVARPNNSAATTESVTPEKSPNIPREKIQIQTHMQIQIQKRIQIQKQTYESNFGDATK